MFTEEIAVGDDCIEISVVFDQPADMAAILAAIEAGTGTDVDTVKMCLQMGAKAFSGLAAGQEAKHLRAAVEDARAAAARTYDEFKAHVLDVVGTTRDKFTADLMAELGEGLQLLAGESGTIDQLRQIFDVQDDQSAVAKLLQTLERTSRQQISNMLEDTNKARQELLDNQEKVTEQIVAAATALAAHAARAEEAAKGTRKGYSHEDGLEAAIGTVARCFGGVVENVSTEPGIIPRSKVGDHVLDLGSNRIVFEEKNEPDKDMTVGRARKLGEEACRNREADACVIVVANQECVPGKQPFAIVSSTLAIVDGSTHYTVQLIAQYMARILAMRSAGATDGDIDGLIDTVHEIVARMTERLKRFSTMRRGVSTAKGGLESISKEIELLDADLKADLAEATEALAERTADAPSAEAA